MSFDWQKWLDDLGPVITTWGIRVAGALLALVVTFIIAGFVRRAVAAALARARVDVTLTKFISKTARWSFLAAALVAILGIFGVETTSFAALIGSVGIAIGIGFQGTLGSLAAGVMLLIFRPFKVGDVVSVGGVVGTVNAIDLFVTTLDTADNRRIILPNTSVFGTTIENITYHPTRRVEVNVGTDYGADLDQTRAVLQEAARSVDKVLADPAPAVVIGDLADSSVTWSVRVWARSEDFWPVRDALTVAVKKHLDQAEIGIPYPQMDVHVQRDDAA